MEITPGLIIAMVVSATIAVLYALRNRKLERAREANRPEPSGPPTAEQVERLVAAGRKIEAIKVYRKLHHVDLKEAKQAVDRMSRS